MAKTKTTKTTKKPAATRKTTTAKKASTLKTTRKAKTPTAETPSTDEAEITIDRRSDDVDRRADDRRTSTEPVAEDRRSGERREKVARRRQIDPTTCERDYTDQEIEFMAALDEYKRKNGRMFPTCSEILEVFRALGYEKATPTTDSTEPVETIVEAAGEQPSIHAPVPLDTDAPETAEAVGL